ncbi:hypothetical protein CapIbe_014423 [Capra ibex]
MFISVFADFMFTRPSPCVCQQNENSVNSLKPLVATEKVRFQWSPGWCFPLCERVRASIRTTFLPPPLWEYIAVYDTDCFNLSTVVKCYCEHVGTCICTEAEPQARTLLTQEAGRRSQPGRKPATNSHQLAT